MSSYLPEYFAVLLGFALLLYGLLDGFDLGVGILLPGLRSETERQLAMNSIAPFWDGNQTWMILAAGLLYGVFPKIYSRALPLFYLPVFIMLVGLIFRGVAFEFCQKNQQHQHYWQQVFSLASLITTLCQGLIVGLAMTQSATFGQRTVIFWLLTTAGMVAAHLLLGASWLLLKGPESLHPQLKKWVSQLIPVTGLIISLLIFTTPWVNHFIAAKWVMAPFVPMLLSLLACYGLLLAQRSLTAQQKAYQTFLWLAASFSCCLLNLASSVWPYILPGFLTIREAAADPQALRFLSIGVLMLLPVLLGYTAYAYYTFRGKVQLTEGY